MKPSKSRLDLALVERNLAPTRTRAQSLIMARRVLVNGHYIDKAGAIVTTDDDLAVVELEHPYVGRGGMKLAHALDHFGIDVSGMICADIGASTGGFTDVLLKRGAAKVYAIDVGYGQLDQSLRADPRVVNRERVNARYLDPSEFDEPPDFVSIDVSFISLTLILPPAYSIMTAGGALVALIKPQFEVGRGAVGKGGIVRDDEKRQEAVDRIVGEATATGFAIEGVIESPIRGAQGNVEYLMAGKKSEIPDVAEDSDLRPGDGRLGAP